MLTRIGPHLFSKKINKHTSSFLPFSLSPVLFFHALYLLTSASCFLMHSSSGLPQSGMSWSFASFIFREVCITLIFEYVCLSVHVFISIDRYSMLFNYVFETNGLAIVINLLLLNSQSTMRRTVKCRISV